MAVPSTETTDGLGSGTGAEVQAAESIGPREGLAAFAGFSALTLALMWPLARAPQRLMVAGPDSYGNVWAIGWVGRQLLRDPTRIFEANGYAHLPHSLAYCESQIAQALTGLPFYLAGGALLAHNAVLLLSFPLAALGAFLLARRLGCSRGGAALAGAGFAFCTYRFDHLVHVQSLCAHWFPFALLMLERLFATGKRRYLVGLLAFSMLQCLASGYYAFLMGPTMAVALAWWTWRTRDLRRALAGVAALGVAALLSLAVLWPHRLVQREQGLSRDRQAAAHWSATWRSYLNPGEAARLPHLRWLYRATAPGEPVFPGTPVLLLVLAAPLLRRSAPALGLGALLAATGIALAMGPQIQIGPWTLPGPFDAVRQLPGVQGLRTPVRFSIVGQLGLCLVAAGAWTALARRWPAASRGSAALLLWVALEAYPFDLARVTQPPSPPPPAIDWLAEAPRGLAIELPWTDFWEGARYLYWSTFHWQPMVNGFGSFEPENSRGLGLVSQRFPARHVLVALRGVGVRYVVVHTELLRPRQRQRLQAWQTLPPGVRLAERFGHDWVYCVSPAEAIESEPCPSGPPP